MLCSEWTSYFLRGACMGDSLRTQIITDIEYTVDVPADASRRLSDPLSICSDDVARTEGREREAFHRIHLSRSSRRRGREPVNGR